MRETSYNQSSNLQQIDMAQLARQSSDAILAFNNNTHSNSKRHVTAKKIHHVIQRTYNHAFISSTATLSMIVILAGGISNI